MIGDLYSAYGLLWLVVFVHEMGHLIVALALGVRVTELSIGKGFGPSVQVRDFKLSLGLLPAGGFVRMGAITGSRWKTFWIIFAGPLANYLSAAFMVFMMATNRVEHDSLNAMFVVYSVVVATKNLMPSLGGDGHDILELIKAHLREGMADATAWWRYQPNTDHLPEGKRWRYHPTEEKKNADA